MHWAKGRVSAYSGVPPEVAEELAKTVSVGTMLHSDIKQNYQHRYVGGDE